MVQKKPEAEHIGHAHHAFADSGPVTRGRSRRDQLTVLPVASERWLPNTQAWYTSLAESPQSNYYEASDWATAVCTAEILDLAVRSRNASIMTAFTKLSERLGATITDRKHAHIEVQEQEISDRDEEAADETIRQWHERLGVPIHPVD